MSNFGLVVIGAHIGIHIAKDLEEYKGQNILLVEPVPHNFAALKENIPKNKKIIIDSSAISGKEKISYFYFIKGDSITKLGKHWASGIGSFDKQHILNHKSKRFKVTEEDIDFLEVQTLTFSNLLKKYNISSIKKLQIDVEGYEYEILNSISFEKILINKIIFESKHFDGTFKEGLKLDEMKKKLITNDYKIVQLDDENILAEKN
jgi:FkbM family methyltransferase